MLKIQILGTGLIPRGYGLAPRKELISADPAFIQVLLRTSGLELKYFNPDSNKLMPLTRDNYQSIYKIYGNGAVRQARVTSETPKIPTPAPTTPHVPEKQPAEALAPKVGEKKEPEQTLTDDSGLLKPITNPNEDKKVEANKGNNNNHGNNNKK